MPTLEFPDNVEVVGSMPRIIEYGGYRILAGTMWTDLSNPLHAWEARRRMHDYRNIRWSKTEDFLPEHTTREWFSFKTVLEEEKPDIVISHHLPSYGSVHEKYGDDTLNAAFATEMDVSGVKLWMHGHTHEPFDYMKDGCRIVCNPRGYPGESNRKYELKEITL